MTNFYTELLKQTSNENITFLKDVKSHIILNKSGKFLYYRTTFFDIRDFLSTLDDNSLYTTIPLISILGLSEDPHIILSKQILITSHSNPFIVREFLIKQLDKAILDFEFNLENKFYYLIFKFKKIHIQI
jgi:hypothetical protein